MNEGKRIRHTSSTIMLLAAAMVCIGTASLPAAVMVATVERSVIFDARDDIHLERVTSSTQGELTASVSTDLVTGIAHSSFTAQDAHFTFLSEVIGTRVLPGNWIGDARTTVNFTIDTQSWVTISASIEMIGAGGTISAFFGWSNEPGFDLALINREGSQTAATTLLVNPGNFQMYAIAQAMANADFDASIARATLDLSIVSVPEPTFSCSVIALVTISQRRVRRPFNAPA